MFTPLDKKNKYSETMGREDRQLSETDEGAEDSQNSIDVIAMYNGFGRICHLFLYLFMKRE
jgi:hypothetical protein